MEIEVVTLPQIAFTDAHSQTNTGVTDSASEPETAVASRTLLAAGFQITGATRQPQHIELKCERKDAFGAVLRYLFAVFECDEPPAAAIEQITQEASRDHRACVVVARSQGTSWVSWVEFMGALGGAVPTWRALNSGFGPSIELASQNKLPAGVSGEAWALFEHLVADGLEFMFGKRVRQMGGRRRGQAVSDLVAQTPDGRILVIDAKASGAAYDVTWPTLRPLLEYVQLQKTRQRGELQVSGALLVSGDFLQDESRLSELAGQFLAEAQVPLGYLRVSTLIELVAALRERPKLRGAVRWTRLFCSGGPISLESCTREIRDAQEQRMTQE